VDVHITWFPPHLLRNVVYNDNEDSLNLGNVQIGNGNKLSIRGYGTVWPFGKVLLVPALIYNLISVRMLTAQGFSIYFINIMAKMEEWETLTNVIIAKVDGEGMYSLEWQQEALRQLPPHSIFNQTLPSRKQPARCLMTRVLTNISTTSRILHDPAN